MTDEQRSSGHGMWPTFFAMIATSIVTMFVLKYSALWELDHAFFSQTRMWMALMMGMAMIVIMLGFMWGMYRSLATKIAEQVVQSVAVIVEDDHSGPLGDDPRSSGPHHQTPLKCQGGRALYDDAIGPLLVFVFRHRGPHGARTDEGAILEGRGRHQGEPGVRNDRIAR